MSACKRKGTFCPDCGYGRCMLEPQPMSTLREKIARIIDRNAWEPFSIADIFHLAAARERSLAKADRVLSLLPLQPDGEVLTAEERRVLDTFTFGEFRPGSEAYAKREGEEQGAASSKTAAIPKEARPADTETSGWRPISEAPNDGTKFLAYQGGEIWRAYGDVNPRSGAIYFVRRTHERQQGRTYRLMEVEVDGVWAQRRVLIDQEPDDYKFHWVSRSNKFDFNPTHWMPLPPPPAENKPLGSAREPSEDGLVQDEHLKSTPDTPKTSGKGRG